MPKKVVANKLDCFFGCYQQ